MERNTFWLLPIVFLCAFAEAGADQPEPGPNTPNATTDEASKSLSQSWSTDRSDRPENRPHSSLGIGSKLQKVVRTGEISSDQFIPLPPGIEIRRHYDRRRGDRGSSTEITGELVYANTGGSVVRAIGVSGRRIADDVTTAAVGGCDVSAYEILVGVRDSDGTGDPYTVEYGIWTACPGASPPGQLVPGTEGTMTFDDDGLLHLITVDLQGSEVYMDSDFWIGAKFTGNPYAGWVAGTPAEMGFTQDIYDTEHPTLRCRARFAGTNLYAGFYIKVYCSGDFVTEFPAYLNPELDGPSFGFPQYWMADDIRLIVDDCVLTSYEVGMRGHAGPFTLEVELWEALGPDYVIEGTQGVFQGIGEGGSELARFTFDDGVPLPTGSLWFAMMVDVESTGFIFAEEAALGYSGDLVAFCDPYFGDCFTYSFGGNPQASFNATINCLGSPPLGACCEIIGSDWGCRETPQISCVGVGARWLEDAPCDPDPFDPPCGGFACCLPEPWPRGSCENLTEEDCIARGGVWDGWRPCGFDGQDCGWFPCRGAEGGCCTEHDSVGCTDMSCCSRVCDADAWCCEAGWDSICVREAKDLCCPAAEVTWRYPPDGVVDARQPHPVNDATSPQGIDTIQAAASARASVCCWTLCETDEGESPNFIAAIQETPGAVYTITLDRPITPGAVTTISYYGDNGSSGTGRFTSHPGNVDGDSEAGPSDILALIDFLDGVGSLPWELYSCDADRSGDCGPPDILRVIDLLNGAGVFVPWNGTVLPLESRVCP